ncbi:MAG: hypothetical protein OEY03_04835 [Rhizobacter sp.]|nr:hypothetical protein [Rhizobacter sp.]
MCADAAAADEPAAAGLPPEFAADLRGHLIAVNRDLDRLQQLLGDACGTLQSGFLGAAAHLEEFRAGPAPDVGCVERAIEHLDTAVTALQVQDLASQLIEHTRVRLRRCADRLARDTPADMVPTPLPPNPVGQTRMGSGFVELF